MFCRELPGKATPESTARFWLKVVLIHFSLGAISARTLDPHGLPKKNRSLHQVIMTMYEMTDMQYQAVYNVLSFALASMMATTVYLWFRSFAVQDKYRSAVLISGLVTCIAAYHYFRIFNSWVEAYSYPAGKLVDGAMVVEDPKLTGVPFNDAYRYMDWLLTVPLLLIEILLVMNLDAETYSEKAKTLGVSSALMIVSGYYGELTVSGNLAPRWICWFVSMISSQLPQVSPPCQPSSFGGDRSTDRDEDDE